MTAARFADEVRRARGHAAAVVVCGVRVNQIVLSHDPIYRLPSNVVDHVELCSTRAFWRLICDQADCVWERTANRCEVLTAPRKLPGRLIMSVRRVCRTRRAKAVQAASHRGCAIASTPQVPALRVLSHRG